MSGVARHHIHEKQAADLLARIAKTRIAFIGDVCLDAYWEADMRRSILSKETPHYPLPVVRERYAPGAGGNVAANLAALRPQTLEICSALGQDWRGMLLREEFERLQIDTSGLSTVADWLTPAYCKPLRKGIPDVCYEDPRIDFENFTPLPAAAEASLLAAIEALRGRVDAIAVTEQFTHTCISEPIRRAICALAQEIPVVVDSRAAANRYQNVVVKPNEEEALRLFGAAVDDETNAATLTEALRRVTAVTGAAAIITMGAGGSICADGGRCVQVPAFLQEPPIDIVGAGDTFLASVTAALGAGAALADAIALGNAASAVTVKKCGMTGTASPEEILAVIRTEGEKHGADS